MVEGAKPRGGRLSWDNPAPLALGPWRLTFTSFEDPSRDVTGDEPRARGRALQVRRERWIVAEHPREPGPPQ